MFTEKRIEVQPERANAINVIILADVTNAAGHVTKIKFTCYGNVAAGGWLSLPPHGKIAEIKKVLSATEMEIKAVDSRYMIALRKKDTCLYVPPTPK